MELSQLPGLGAIRCESLRAAGILNARDLVERLPLRYQDSTAPRPLRQLQAGDVAAFSGVVRRLRSHWVHRKALISLSLEDAEGYGLRCVWFGARWLMDRLREGQCLLLYGRIARDKEGRIQAVHPAIVDTPGILPQYAPLDKLPPKVLRRAVAYALEHLPAHEPVPQALVDWLDPGSRRQALWQAHFPSAPQALEAARRRLAYEQLLLYQAGLHALKGSLRQGIAIPCGPAQAEAFWRGQAFPPTAAQKRVSQEIYQDLRAPHAMARLVQGDVGCGKTAIAFCALYAAAQAGYQGAMMAPTEILASQHLESARRMLEPLGLRCGLLTGSLGAAQRRAAYRAIASGEWQAVFGTHALLAKGVAFHRLGLVITDEQHRFGVQQRAALAQKGSAPNVLVMSATPIPRTLALLMHGDLQLSVVDELPPGRRPVETRFVPERKREALYGFVRDQVALGHQAYVVCPLVEESATEDCLSATLQYEDLATGALRGLRLGLVHGAQSAAEKERNLSAFHQGALDVLVATTVIEVGVDAPNASIMLIENPERFGLSQLHQLRGRVGRGTAQSWCFLMGSPNERLECLAQTNDGFAIAQKDLELRGPGEALGLRQHGLPGLGEAAGCMDLALLERAHGQVQALLRDPAQSAHAERLMDSAAKRFAHALANIAMN